MFYKLNTEISMFLHVGEIENINTEKIIIPNNTNL